MTLLDRTWRRRIVATAGLAAGCLLFSAAPAMAEPPGNSAFGVAVTGPVSLGPLPTADFPNGPGSSSLASASAPGVLTTGVLTASAGAVHAEAIVANVDATLSKLLSLTATGVDVTCSFNPSTDTVSGATSITNGTINGLNLSLLSSPGPNTNVLGLPAGLGTITLNRQVTNPDGSLTVDGIYITLLSNSVTVTVGSTTCQKAAVVGTPIMAKSFAIGAGVAALLGVTAYLGRLQLVGWWRRLRTSHTA